MPTFKALFPQLERVEEVMRYLKNGLAVVAFCGIFSCRGGLAQHVGNPPKQWHERYPTEMARLESMTFVPISTWRFHDTDLPHGEDPSLDDSGWQTVSVDDSRGSGNTSSPRVPRGWYRVMLQLPSAAGGQDIAGARVRLVVRSLRTGASSSTEGWRRRGTGALWIRS